MKKRPSHHSRRSRDTIEGFNRGHRNLIPHPPKDDVRLNLPNESAYSLSFQSSSSFDKFSHLVGFLPRTSLYGSALQKLDDSAGTLIKKDSEKDEQVDSFQVMETGKVIQEREIDIDGEIDENEEDDDDDDNFDEDHDDDDDDDDEEEEEYDTAVSDGDDKTQKVTLTDEAYIHKETALVDEEEGHENRDKNSLSVHSSKDPFMLRFSGSSYEEVAEMSNIVSAEAALKASRVLTSIDKVGSTLHVNAIGANPIVEDGSLLHGGAINVHISASVGEAADDVKDMISLLKDSKQSQPGTNYSLYSTPFVDLSSLTGGCVEKSLVKAWNTTYGSEPATLLSELRKSVDPSLSQNLTPLQFSLWKPLSSYRDIHFTLRSFDNGKEIRTLSALHVANHLLKARNLISGHDRQINEALIRAEEVKKDKLMKKDELKQTKNKNQNGSFQLNEEIRAAGNIHGIESAAISIPEFRDQGFSRPRVLVLLPHRHSALQFVRSLIRLLTEGSERQVANRKRFFDEFTEADESKAGENDADDELDCVKAVLSKISQSVHDMMSDDDNFDDYENNEDGDISNDSVTEHEFSSTYPFSKFRQGWPKHLKKKVEHARLMKRLALAQRNETDSEDNNDDISDEKTSLIKQQRGSNNRGRKRHKADRTERSQSALQKECILGSTALYEAAVVKKAKALEQKALRSERENRYAFLNPTPKDFKKTFAGNIDDDFKLGISLSRKQMKLYSPFYESDLIIASPLGLRRVMGGEGEGKREIDFLSSIEVVIVDEADILLQQNWHHVKDIFSALNVMPLSSQHTDFSRVREGDLAGTLRFNRQTIVFSSYYDAEISSLMKKSCYNAIGGRIFLCSGRYRGSIMNVVPTIRQSFINVSTTSLPRVTLTGVADSNDSRIDTFKSLVLPLLKQRRTVDGEDKSAQQPHTLIFIPSYFDYVRLRNLLDSEEVEFSTCSEYSDDRDIATVRKSFRRGDSTTILVTERFHFFRRVKFWGVQHVVFYGPPRVANSYPEVLNWIKETHLDRGEDTNEARSINTSLLLYSKFDSLQIERICGSERALGMFS
jgi:hypothetical protein